MLSRDEILGEVRRTLKELFEIDPAKVHLETHVIDDLGLDSIDAIDLAVKIEEMTGQRLPEEALRGIRKVSDVVDIIEGITAKK